MSTQAEAARAAINALLARHSVTLACVFVPKSMSRNSAEKAHTLNWRASFTSSRGAFALDYVQGIGHVPNYREPRTLWDEQMLGRPWETGTYNLSKTSAYIHRPKLPAPLAADILYCIVLDSSACDQSFEGWAMDCGYDPDSRKAERIYHECKRQAESALRILGADLLKEAAEILTDY